MEFVYIVGIVCLVFLSTNMDNLLCLIGFFSNTAIKTKHIIFGWFTGSFLIILISLLTAFVGAATISQRWIGILGIIPIILGIKNLFALKNGTLQNFAPAMNVGTSKSHIFTGAAVTITNGCDNVSAYTPLFILAKNPHNIIITICTFIFMTVIFCIVGYFLVRKNEYIGKQLSHYGPIILPFVLIFLGTSILIQSFSK